MKKILVFSSFVLGNFAILVLAVLLFSIYSTKRTTAVEVSATEVQMATASSGESFDASPDLAPQIQGNAVAADARVFLIDNFFRNYGSPMTGLGYRIVAAADRYRLPFGLLPAIAQCEGNLGKAMPYDSFNPYGYGIYGDTVTRFSSWQEGIEMVSKTLRTDYYDLGLDTPEKIMHKYTPPSKGSWAICVNQYLQELR